MSAEKKEIPQLTDEELDKVADTAIEYLKAIITPFGLGEITINEYEGAERELILDINGDNLAVLIGMHGNTLDSIQQIISLILRNKLDFYYPVIIDVEGYKSRQRMKLEKTAKNIANKVSATGRDYKMYPMSSYKRRIIHSYLANDDRVNTHSEGEGRKRHLIVSPA